MAEQVDAVVVGLGPGGEGAAGRLAEAGWSVVGIEDRLVDGECPYWGCVPTKMMVRAADASLTLDTLWVAACPDEAGAFLDWLVGAAAADVHDGHSLQIMYGVGGEHDLSDRDLGHLEGWRGNGPVRVGNGAWQQRQLDVHCELIDAVQRLRDRLGAFDEAQRAFLISVPMPPPRRGSSPTRACGSCAARRSTICTPS